MMMMMIIIIIIIIVIIIIIIIVIVIASAWCDWVNLEDGRDCVISQLDNNLGFPWFTWELHNHSSVFNIQSAAPGDNNVRLYS